VPRQDLGDVAHAAGEERGLAFPLAQGPAPVAAQAGGELDEVGDPPVRARESSNEAHWNGVHGLGTNEETDRVSLPNGFPSGPRTCSRSSSRAARSGIASTCSRVSVGSPIMK